MMKYALALHNKGVKIKTNITKGKAMHCKFIIVDGKWLAKGSMNLGKKSLKNYEHLELTKNEKAIWEFMNRFEKMW
jgi:phosphatidylserine/phosphatidylglycerophosphate/cardiolipin synthase-like enzyme